MMTVTLKDLSSYFPRDTQESIRKNSEWIVGTLYLWETAFLWYTVTKIKSPARLDAEDDLRFQMISLTPDIV